MAYTVYQVIELHVPQLIVGQGINQLFHLQLASKVVKRQKSTAAQMYKGTYEGILRKIVKGRLIHADETQVSIEGEEPMSGCLPRWRT